MKAIYTRRSIRHYRPDPVSEDLVTEVIRAGMNAPSAGNEQPWQFLVIYDRSKIDAITSVHPNAKMLHEAPVAILVCADRHRFQYSEYWIQDCAAATENMLIMAADLGLGSVWLGVYSNQPRVEGITRIFSLPENIVPFAVIPLGWPAETKEPNNRFDRSRIHYDTWND